MADFIPKTDWQDGETVSAEDLNRIEQGIAEGNSSFTPKTWADGQVPGADGWNRVENGIMGMIEPYANNFITEETVLNSSTDFALFAVKPGETYLVIAEMKAETAASGAQLYWVQYYQSTTSGRDSYIRMAANVTTEYQYFYNTFTVPDGINYARIGYRIVSTTGDQTYRLLKVEPYLYMPATWGNDDVIHGDDMNHIEQGVSDVLQYIEDNPNVETASPQSVEDSDEVAAPEAEEIE